MKQFVFLYAIVMLCYNMATAQEYPLVLNKQGSFKVTDWGAYTHYDCGYTKAETTANYQKVLTVINAIKKGNPVLNELKGFDAELLVFAQQCDPKFGYGIPVKITFGFCAWFVNKNGKEVCNKIEPPAWYMNCNILGNIGSQSYEPLTPKKNLTKEDKWRAAGRKLNELVRVQGPKETLAPGSDRYNNYEVVVYNPARPAYWLPVTVREVYQLTFDYYKLDPDSLSRSLTLQILENEYATFTEEERDSYAYSVGKGGLAQVGLDETSRQIMRPNPAYWNRSLPKSAIQIIRFNLPADREYMIKEAAQLKSKNVSFYETSFEAALDVLLFASLIDK
jgi:hypothetical protein